jgi:hypothetical protein
LESDQIYYVYPKLGGRYVGTPITITAASTADNTSPDDLVVQVLAAINTTSFAGKFSVSFDSSKNEVLAQLIAPYYNADIGVRSGASFGYATRVAVTGVPSPTYTYDTMGGLFAGMGGAGLASVGAKAGVSGSVTNISADSIASIVAGKLCQNTLDGVQGNGDTLAAGNLVNKVDFIKLNKANQSTVDSTGAFGAGWNGPYLVGTVAHPGFNFVGAVVDPFAAHANLFDPGSGETPSDPGNPAKIKWADTAANGTFGTFGIGDAITTKTDGFIAAVTYPLDKLNHTNFVPEALLTVGDAKSPASISNSNFIDNNNVYILA